MKWRQASIARNEISMKSVVWKHVSADRSLTFDVIQCCEREPRKIPLTDERFFWCDMAVHSPLLWSDHVDGCSKNYRCCREYQSVSRSTPFLQHIAQLSNKCDWQAMQGSLRCRAPTLEVELYFALLDEVWMSAAFRASAAERCKKMFTSSGGWFHGLTDLFKTFFSIRSNQ